MSETVVSAEGLGKRYRLRHRHDNSRYQTLSDVLVVAARAPFQWIAGDGRRSVTTDDFWAMRDVSFEIKRGDVVGVIGRNGAGKSTLLKILSRITEPTAGRVTLYGRTASLLEVGTGFHPELTGRENIFLNGAILGMTRAEILRNFDAIVEFAGVEHFLETPVKRYSSGMYVRLAFAVAAHLEPEVLIVDEVLAVGDLEFQQRSLGKMYEVSRGGRTVIFVSHNMAAINALTRRTIVMDHGQVAFDGSTADAIGHYSQLAARTATPSSISRGAHTAILGVAILDETGAAAAHYTPGTLLRVAVNLETDGTPGLSVEAFLVDAMHQKLAMASLHQFEALTLPEQPGQYRIVMDLQPGWLASGSYALDVTTSIVNSSWDHYVDNAASVDVIASNPGGQAWDFRHDYGYGAFAMPCLTRPDITRTGNVRG